MSAPLPAPASTGRAPRRGLLLRGALATALSLTGLGAVALAPSPAQAAVTCAAPFSASGERCAYTKATPGSATVDIPANATDVEVELAGARGGSSEFGSVDRGGAGGKVAGDLAGVAGSTLILLVGERGRTTLVGGTTATVGGGGAAGLEGQSGGGDPSGGGGTFLARGTDLIAVAGGGGASDSIGDQAGGAGTGGAMAGAGAAPVGYTTAKGGTSSAGGTGAQSGSEAGSDGSGPARVTAGTISPGVGGSAKPQANGFANDGGGGGGGYFGGGGGILDAAAGGGSGYSAGLTGVVTESGLGGGNLGDGYAKISYVPAVATPPGAAQDVTVTPGNRSATISWEAPASDGGAPITQYEVYRRDSGGPIDTESPGVFICEIDDPDAALTCEASGLVNGTTYWFTVVAYNGAGTGAYSVPVSTTPVAPPVEVATGNQLFQAFGSGGAGCGTTVRLTGPIAQALDVSHQCGAAPITLDLNGHDLTLDLLTSSFMSAAGDVHLINSDQTKGATLTSTLAVYQGDVRVGRGVTVVAASRTTSAGEIFPGAFIGSTGDFIVDGGTVRASSSDPLVPAIGGRVTQGLHTIHGTGRVVLESGEITASRTGPTGTSPVIGGATVQALATSTQNTTVPVVIRGGTLTLDAGAASAPAYGVGGGYTPPLSFTTGRLVLAGTSASPAKVVLSEGTIPSALIDGADGALPTHNELDNSGALLPDQNGVVQIPEAIKVTGHHYRVAFPGDTLFVAAAKTLAAGGGHAPGGLLRGRQHRVDLDDRPVEPRWRP